MTLYRRLAEDRHPDYDDGYWSQIEALYAGGKKLLRDERMLKEVFPKHQFEQPRVYKERCRRAVYIPYMGQLLDHTVAAVGGDPIKVDGLPEGDGYYDDLIHDTSGPGHARVPLNALLLMQLLRALKFQRAWTHVELPALPGDVEGPMSRAQEQEMGLDRPYLCIVEPGDVLDWDFDEDGKLDWVITRNVRVKRPSIDGPRNLCVETYTRYDSATWRRWVVKYDPTGKTPDFARPKLDDDIGPGIVGVHSFQRVPFSLLEVTDGLWFGNKAESLQREHFNKLSALSWGQLRTLFAFMYVKLAAPDPKNPVSEDINRDTNQTIGPGNIMRLAQGDEVGYAAPPDGPFGFALQFLNVIRDEMHRLLTRMSQSIDQSAAALQRSGKSKQVDQSQEAILFEKLGSLIRDHAAEVLELVMLGRGDLKVAAGAGEEAIKLTVTGADSYDDLSFGDLIAAVLQLDTIGVPSAEFQVMNKLDLVRRRFPGLDPEKAQVIEDQLRSVITQDQLEQLPGDPEPDADEPDEPADNEPPPKEAKKSKKKAADKKPAKEADNA